MSKLREAANGESCVRCGIQDQTTVLAHYSGPWQHRFGKGTRIKGNDAAGADLCSRCHTELDEYQTAQDEVSALRRSEEFLAMCLLTVIRRISKGVLK